MIVFINLKSFELVDATINECSTKETGKIRLFIRLVSLDTRAASPCRCCSTNEFLVVNKETRWPAFRTILFLRLQINTVSL